jgi:hypothetical protein
MLRALHPVIQTKVGLFRKAVNVPANRPIEPRAEKNRYRPIAKLRPPLNAAPPKTIAKTGSALINARNVNPARIKLRFLVRSAIAS